MGKENISINLDGALIDAVDKTAKKLDISRPILIRRAIGRFIVMSMDTLEFWENMFADYYDNEDE